MGKCKSCWWQGKAIDCPADFDIDTKECKNFENKYTKEGVDKNETERQQIL